MEAYCNIVYLEKQLISQHFRPVYVNISARLVAFVIEDF
jgi:hypothetical protein